VAAVATLLGLLLVVTFVANDLLQPLPSDMQALEENHELLLEDEVAQLQATLVAQIKSPGVPVTLASPVALGSAAFPPFGTSSSGSIVPTVSTPYESVDIPTPVAPNWGNGSLCTTHTASGCGNTQSNVCSPVQAWNESVSNTTYTFTLTGSSDCQRLNFTGSHDVIDLGVTGSNLGYFILTLFGFNDTVLLTNQFSGSGFHAYFYLYGENNTYEGTGGPTGSHMFLNTYFIGETKSQSGCGVANDAATDKWSITGSSSSNSVQNLTWYNSIGVSTPYHTTNGWPGIGNSGTGDTLGWQNVSASVNCAFIGQKTLGLGWGGLYVFADNVYSPEASVALDSGAVVYGELGGAPVMAQTPPWTLTLRQGGTPTLALTLFDFSIANLTAISGRQTAAVLTHVEWESIYTLNTTVVTVNVPTAYPQAWMQYLSSAGSGTVPGSASCSGSTSSCLAPRAGTTVTVSAEFDVSALTLTVAVVELSLT
jgi:hypothetical protein